ncbi:DNA ligase, partial [Lelliottia amnigena]|nr:DNA ligase [Lelliottia amnigena]
MNEIIIKFPSTPHFSISLIGDVRNDKLLEESVQKEIFKNELIIEEKIDGANLGISFNSEADIILQNRGSILRPPYLGQ